MDAVQDGESGFPRHDQRILATALAALGVVYGDIGTSPLYTLRTAFDPVVGIPLTDRSVLGILSLIFWALILVVTVKYVLIVLRADNRGEGGILALATLAASGAVPHRRRRRLAVALGLVGAALFYGDGLITPAISVLSAIEGLNIATHLFQPYVVPLALIVLFGLFMVQSRGTASVGRLFGPVMLVWFTCLAVLGLREIIQAPGVLRALDPSYAAWLFVHHGWLAFAGLGAVLLAVTGAEALYADMGHFGRRPIRMTWFVLVLPALLLNYFGQGALLIHDPGAIRNPFYLLAPEWAVYPMVILSTIATIIASQAIISGAFSLTRQAVQLGFLPRLEIRHTSESAIGQVYIPQVNWTLLCGVVVLVLGFESSDRLAGAYGFAVTGAMVIDSILLYIVLRYVMNWPQVLARILITCFLVIDISLFTSALLKVPNGGWVPLLLAIVLFVLMTTWLRGRQVLYDVRHRDAPEIQQFVEKLGTRPPMRVTGTAVFMTGNAEAVPGALLHNLKHNKVLHERVVLLTVRTEEVPRISESRRLTVDHLKGGFHRIIAQYGYVERPDVPQILELARRYGLSFDLMETSFFLSRETFVPSNKPDMPRWRERIFIVMSGMAIDATEFFRIPPGRVVELGSQIEI